MSPRRRRLKKLPDTVAEIAAAHPGQAVEVWFFEDEARFGQKGTLTTVWADTGSRPTAPKQGGFQSLHVLTVVCPKTGHAEGHGDQLRCEADGLIRFRIVLRGDVEFGCFFKLGKNAFREFSVLGTGYDDAAVGAGAA